MEALQKLYTRFFFKVSATEYLYEKKQDFNKAYNLGKGREKQRERQRKEGGIDLKRKLSSEKFSIQETAGLAQ